MNDLDKLKWILADPLATNDEIETLLLQFPVKNGEKSKILPETVKEISTKEIKKIHLTNRVNHVGLLAS